MQSSQRTAFPFNILNSSENVTAPSLQHQQNTSTYGMINNNLQDVQDAQEMQATSERSRTLQSDQNLDTPSSVYIGAPASNNNELDSFDVWTQQHFSTAPLVVSQGYPSAQMIQHNQYGPNDASATTSAPPVTEHNYSGYQDILPSMGFDYLNNNNTNAHGQMYFNFRNTSAHQAPGYNTAHFGFHSSIQPDPHQHNSNLFRQFSEAPNNFGSASTPDSVPHGLPTTHDPFPQAPDCEGLPTATMTPAAEAIAASKDCGDMISASPNSDRTTPCPGCGQASPDIELVFLEGHCLKCFDEKTVTDRSRESKHSPAPIKRRTVADKSIRQSTRSQQASEPLTPSSLHNPMVSKPLKSRKRKASSGSAPPSKRIKVSIKGLKGIDFEPARQPDQDAKGPLQFHLVFNTPEEARYYRDHPRPEEMRKFSVPGDNIDEVVQDHDQICAHIVDAVQDRNWEPPLATWTEEIKSYYNASQQAALEVIKREIRTEQDHKRTIANVVILFDEIIAVNKFGLPEKLIRELEQGRGHVPDCTLTTKERAEHVIAVIKKNKTIAKQVIRGEALQDLARSPDRIHRSKAGNAALNAKRAGGSKAEHKNGRGRNSRIKIKEESDEDEADTEMNDVEQDGEETT